MNSENTFSFIPQELPSLPWIERLVALLQEHTQFIQEQTQLIEQQTTRIQEQAEEITKLKKIVQEQRDEINRLKNMPKRPKFRPGGGDPKSRSGKPSSNKERHGLSDIVPKKIR